MVSYLDKVRRESGYYGGPGRKWDCSAFAYAAARDAACWQLNRTEGEVRELLADFTDAATAKPPAKPARSCAVVN